MANDNIPIAISGVGYVYDEYDIEIGRFLVDSTLRMAVPQYFFCILMVILIHGYLLIISKIVNQSQICWNASQTKSKL